MSDKKTFTFEVEERQIVTYRVQAENRHEARELIESGYGEYVDREDAFIPEGAEMTMIEMED